MGGGRTKYEENKGLELPMKPWRTLGLVLGLALATLPQSVIALDIRAQRGLTFVRTHCGGCHAIGKAGESPLPAAVPFRMLHTRYPVDDLAEAFAEGIVTGHPTMPEWRLDPPQIGDLLAYLRSLQP